jgi:serine/threonine protein phosphatase 1
MGLYAIGDLHGCPEELEILLDHVAPGAADRLVFLGDYVDRGPGVRTLITRLLRLREGSAATVFLRGNHEDMLLDYLGLPGRYAGVYLANGGAATLASYRIPPGVVGRAAAALLPADHLQFLLALEWSYVADRFLFVHAGIRPGVPLAEQEEEDLIWIREEFFTRAHDLPYTVVYGHSPQREVRLGLPFHVGLDTGLVYGNKLSCLDVDERRLLQVARGARHVVVTDVRTEFSAASV